MKFKLLRIVILSLLIIPVVLTSQIVAQDVARIKDTKYFRAFREISQKGRSIDKTVIMGPPNRPEGYVSTRVQFPESTKDADINVLPDVPAFDWSFGCSATSAAMIAGYYDRTGYPNMYNQYIYGYGGNTNGFTYAQYCAEIDAGHPVMIHIEGHTMVGVGYDNSVTNLMYIHDTWDYNTYTMVWGGSYAGMKHYGVTIVQLELAVVGCQSDFDGDGYVYGSDLVVFTEDFGRTDCSGDCEGVFDPDGDVDGSDLVTFIVDFGRTNCP